MGFEVKLYSFSKRDNSTDRPETEIITATGNLKSRLRYLKSHN